MPKKQRTVAPHFAHIRAADGESVLVFGPGIELRRSEFGKTFKPRDSQARLDELWALLTDAAESNQSLLELEALEARDGA